MKVIYNKIIPFKGFVAINLFGVIFARKEYKPLSEQTINHEKIHTAQMKELLYIGFYLWYLLSFLYLVIKYSPKKAYRNICFEKEAYANENDLSYLNNRKRFDWLKY